MRHSIRRLWPSVLGGRRSLALLCLVVLTLVAIPHDAKAWWNGDWSYRKKITVDGGAKGAGLTEDAGRMPLLVRLHDGNFKFSDAKDDGSDLRFVDGDDKTPLKFHIETYDGLLGIALVWVDMPAVKAGATSEIWLYYGNPKAPNGADPKGTYDENTTLVYHFAEQNAPPTDQTAYANNGQTPAKSVDSSVIGRGIRLDGTNPITIPATPSLAIAAGGALTWSAWIKADAAQPNAVIFAKRDGDNALIVGLDQDAPYVSVTSGATTLRTAPVSPVTPAQWHYLAVTASDHIAVYLDGKPVTTLSATLPALAATASIGADTAAPAAAAPATPIPAAPAKPGAAPPPAPIVQAAPTSAAFVGELDELELAKIARSPGFIAAAFASQGPDAPMMTFGEDEENASWSGGYFGVILRSVTIDGWVVIGILMVMAVISWVVMITKAMHLNQVTRANERFLEAFTHAGADPRRFEAQIASTDTSEFENSVLFRVCQAGDAELARRVGADQQSPPVLSTEAVATIRANLDRVATYESQSLNSQMVLLTIAISGGPFLGLLGTVVGVMITFAAIAASGDVNVNAIAPGIAAALVATVAGLSVAIPALFGYNYLITRIKDVTTEMHVFVDEFVTRLAEAYRARSGADKLAAE